MIDKFAENWLGKQVSFKLLDKTITGTVMQVLDTVCAPMCLIVEFESNNKQVKVCGSYQGFKRIKAEK